MRVSNTTDDYSHQIRDKGEGMVLLKPNVALNPIDARDTRRQNMAVHISNQKPEQKEGNYQL